MTKKRVFTYVTEEIKEKLEKIAKKKTIKVSPLIEEIINEHFDENTDALNKYSFLDDACPMLRYLEEDEAPRKKGEGFYCLKRSPKVDLLGSGSKEAARKYCDVCKFRDGVIDYNKILIKQVKRGTIIKVPSCIHGGKLSEDGKELFCLNPKLVAQYRNVDKWCKTLRNGANCSSLRWTTMEIKGNIPDINNKR